MKFRIEVHQKEILESGIKGVKIQEWLLFDVVRHMIGADWTKKITENEKSYAWISEQSILDEIPLLELSKRQVHRLVDKLVDAGLLIRFAGNQGMKRVYLGLTPIGDSIGRHSLPEMSDSNGSECQKRQAESDRNGKLSLTEVSEDYNTKYNTTNYNIIYPDSQANGLGEGKSEAKSKRTPTEKKRITFEQSVKFYTDQLNALPEFEDSSPAAARADGYAKMVGWMKSGDVEVPNGLRDTVMRMGTQLSFDQVVVLLDEVGLNWYQIKHYLLRLHNYTENKNSNVFLTIRNWYRMDVGKGAVPPKSGNSQGNSATGLSKPKEVHQ